MRNMHVLRARSILTVMIFVCEKEGEGRQTLNVSPPPSNADAASADSDDAMNTAGAAALQFASICHRKCQHLFARNIFMCRTICSALCCLKF